MSGVHEPRLVSVIIPSHNRARLIGETLESVAAQSYRPIEVLVVDDGSTDDTESVVRACGEKADARLSARYLRQPHRGAQEARNRGFRESHGEFIQFLDSDDVLMRRKLSSQVAALAHGEAHVADSVYGDARYMIESAARRLRLGSKIGIGPTDDFLTTLLSGSWNPTFSYLHRRNAVISAGGWDESIPINQDFDFVLRIALAGGRFAYQPGITGLYRKHSSERITGELLAPYHLGGGFLMRRLEALQGTRMPAADRDELFLGTTRRILERAERVLATRGGLSPVHRRALAQRYFALGRRYLASDSEAFLSAVAKARAICPEFAPPGTVDHWMSALLGYSGWARLVSLGKSVEARLGRALRAL